LTFGHTSPESTSSTAHKHKGLPDTSKPNFTQNRLEWVNQVWQLVYHVQKDLEPVHYLLSPHCIPSGRVRPAERDQTGYLGSNWGTYYPSLDPSRLLGLRSSSDTSFLFFVCPTFRSLFDFKNTLLDHTRGFYHRFIAGKS